MFLLFRYYIPMVFLHFIYLNKLESQSPKDALYHVEIGQVILEKKMKMWNLYRHMDDSQETIRKVYCTWAFCTGELKTHFCLYHPSLEKQLTRHCCNSLQWWWQINCLCLHHLQCHLWQDSWFEVWACMIKYRDCWKKKQLQLVIHTKDLIACNSNVRFDKKFERI